jgi:hypothetical protein
VFSLLSGALLGLVPPQPSLGKTRPDFDLGFLTSRDGEKCKALLVSFASVAPLLPRCGHEMLSFQRSVAPAGEQRERLEDDFWPQCPRQLCPVAVRADGTKDDVPQALHADFANAFVGGGVLMGLTASEEVTFTVCPELLVSMLFCERMLDYEAIVIAGAQRWARHTGYGSSFACGGMADGACEAAALDGLMRRPMHMVAMDALEACGDGSAQFEQAAMRRELLKALVAFRGDEAEAEGGGRLRPVATGNWGCGTFGGDPQLKFLLQWMACSVAGREMVYFTHGDSRIQPQVDAVVEVLSGRTVGEVWRLLGPRALRGGECLPFSFGRLLAEAQQQKPRGQCAIC